METKTIYFRNKPIQAVCMNELYFDGGMQYETNTHIYSVDNDEMEANVRVSKKDWGGSRRTKKAKARSFRFSIEVDEIISKQRDKTFFLEKAVLAFASSESVRNHV